jgi:hypothetical protein
MRNVWHQGVARNTGALMLVNGRFEINKTSASLRPPLQSTVSSSPLTIDTSVKLQKEFKNEFVVPS